MHHTCDIHVAVQLHVLVDLDMWMRGRWPELGALRPAPVQLAYLGYPGMYLDMRIGVHRRVYRRV